MEDSEQRMSDLMKKLQKDRLITITIGKNNKPIQIQQETLEAASTWFTAALRHHTFVEGQNAKLNFPDDCHDVWSLFVYWMINHDFAVYVKNEESLKLAQQCWIFGDKYDIKRFQNEAMLKIICYFDGTNIHPWSQERINATLEFCPSGSPLGRVVAEEVAQCIHSGHMTWDMTYPATTQHIRSRSKTEQGMADSKQHVTKSLQTQDQLSKITIGIDGSPPIYIQQRTLESVAPWLENALMRDTFIEGQTGALHFPVDDQEAWQVLVYWIMTREVAIELTGTMKERARSCILCAKCWVLGDKYDIPVFQNGVMAILLSHFLPEYTHQLPRKALNQILKACPPDSKLAEHFAFAIVEEMEFKRIDWPELRSMDVGHIWSSFCKAQEDLDCGEGYRSHDFKAPTFKQSRGGRFMVGDKVMAGVQNKEHV
ncbi:hypothetical protein AC579_70 [Pseudocercospora musae]|uniref:BTB domain-containing protein n=1 Tax=Pseudocercospora musae TaxID=113226 RepID=A0A139I2S9_9PEZI|nr:hypothetical protein AC579_70 [Pseudocercospora musae]KXT08992.1 hypothetical protein AC579_70 [Pseudocercospora musae]